ncbi:MAG: hypothetical protein GWN94_18765, partial [Phycisphaerae bacterium]|nr:hypothetical protein [Phycisphaerae bacterium]
AYGGHFEGIFELDLDTTDADGYNTIDLTTWFSEVFAILDGGSENEHGYVPKFTVPDNGVAAS